MPVSMSTVTSVNCTPLVPVDDRPSSHFAVDRDRLGADQLARVFPRHALRRVAGDVDAAVRRGERRGIHAQLRRDFRAQLIERLAGGDANRRASSTPPSCCRPIRR